MFTKLTAYSLSQMKRTFAHSSIHISVEMAQINIIFYISVVKLFVINSVLTQPQL